MNAPKNILLIEPGYPNKYPPLGLMKIAAYHGVRGRGDNVVFIKGANPKVLAQRWDRVYVTTLFSFEWKTTSKAIDFAIEAAAYQSERVFVGGISASLMHDSYVSEPRWAGVRFIKGLLDSSPATALKLSAADGDFGADDCHSTPIEELVPDYSILDQISDMYIYPVNDAYFGYASRGCVRKCAFCGVPKLEGPQREMPPLAQLVRGVSDNYGEKKDLVLMDNNITASSRFKEVIAEIRDLGFTPNAALLKPNGRSVGVASISTKVSMHAFWPNLRCFSGKCLRFASAHCGLLLIIWACARCMKSRYAWRRTTTFAPCPTTCCTTSWTIPRTCINACGSTLILIKNWGLRIWSFPMRYQPVTLKDRTHVGKHWNRYYLRSFQIMLQATRGVVSGAPDFFCRAYGNSPEDFQRLLRLPHAFIFHRDYYENPARGGRAVMDEYLATRAKLSLSQEQELASLLAGPSDQRTVSLVRFRKLAADSTVDPIIRQVLRYHAFGTHHPPGANVGAVDSLFDRLNPDPVLPDEEKVEDAGLFGPDDQDGRRMTPLDTCSEKSPSRGIDTG